MQRPNGRRNSGAMPRSETPKHVNFLDLGYNQDLLGWLQSLYPDVRILDVAALRDVFARVRNLFGLDQEEVTSYAFGADYGDRHAKYLKVLENHGFQTRTQPPAELYVTSHFGGSPDGQSKPLLSPSTVMAFAAGQLAERASIHRDSPSLVVLSGRYELCFVMRGVLAAGGNVILLGARSMMDGRFFTNRRLEEVLPDEAGPDLLDDPSIRGRILFMPLEAFGETLINRSLEHLIEEPEPREEEEDFRF